MANAKSNTNTNTNSKRGPRVTQGEPQGAPQAEIVSISREGAAVSLPASVAEARAARLARMRAAMEAAAVTSKEIAPQGPRGPIPCRWDAELTAACKDAGIELPEFYPKSGLGICRPQGGLPTGFFRSPKCREQLMVTISENAAVRRNDPLVNAVRLFILSCEDELTGPGAPIVDLVLFMLNEYPDLMASTRWAMAIQGPQSILSHLAADSGRYALLTPETGLVKLSKAPFN